MSHNKSISWLLMLKSSPLSHDSFVKNPSCEPIPICMYVCMFVCIYMYVYTHTHIYVCVCFNFQCCVCEKPKPSWGHADDLHDSTVISALNACSV